MTDLIDAYSQNDIKRFERILKSPPAPTIASVCAGVLLSLRLIHTIVLRLSP